MTNSPIGQAWLRSTFALDVLAPAVESYAVAGSRRTQIDGTRSVEFYPMPYRPDDTVEAHLKFALRYEPLDLGIVVAALKVADPTRLADWIRSEPTGGFARRVWFLFETFAGRGTLDVEDARLGNYVAVLDPSRHVVGNRRNSRRHRVMDNLLGGPDLCPTVRLTPRLTEQMRLSIDQEGRALVASYDPVTLARAISYLYTKETRSSFAIEGETPNPKRAERFVALLRDAPAFRATDAGALVALQNEIVDSRYAATGWRTFQNFVGETTLHQDVVNFVCPKPDDVAGLMSGWARLTDRLMDGVDPVVAAAVSAFAFVFIHPFEDGNGRIHRFLMHHILAARRYSPDGTIFPVSAAIIRDRRGYDAALESFSRPRLKHTVWDWNADQTITVTNETADLYRFFDATVFAEYLYDRVVETVRTDLKEELGFVAIYDRAFEAVREVVDMPDRRASLLIRLVMQNGGRLSAAKRGLFPELSDGEIEAMEEACREATRQEREEHP